jgi:hypothetical protein
MNFIKIKEHLMGMGIAASPARVPIIRATMPLGRSHSSRFRCNRRSVENAT